MCRCRSYTGFIKLFLRFASLYNNIATVLSMKNDAAIEDIEKRLNDLQIQLLKLASAYADITQVTKEIYRLRDENRRLRWKTSAGTTCASGTPK